MSIQVDPLIQEKLGAFAARRRRLIIMRGILAAVAMLLGTMLVVAAIDYLWILPDWARWALSGAAYLAVLVIVWRQCLRQLVLAPDARQLARLVEHAEPRLREDLISAVELGSARGEFFDSEEFRELLQQDVAHRMEGLEITSLLPVTLIRRTIGYAMAIGAAVIALMFATGWQFHTLLLRALLPGANLERVSRTKITIEEPEKGDRIVPQGDTVRVVVVLGGQNASRAKIETFGESEGRQVMDMQPLEGNRFAATVQVGRESVGYRIRAGDALTRKYHLDARERPFATQFEKTFHPPAYTGMPPRTVVEAEGGLSALEGTEVDLKVKANQPVKSAELRVELGRVSSIVPLTKDADGRLRARLTLSANGSYRVRLVGAETGFENKFSPENEIRAEPDLVPTVELELPAHDLILPANEVVDIAGNAADDLGLAKVSQWVKVNEGGWKETVLLTKPGKNARVDTRWDLFTTGVKPGDLLTTKLVVTDIKGSKGESRSLQVSVTAAGFEMKRLQTLDGLRKLNSAVSALAGQADELSKTVRKAGDGFQRSDETGTARRQALLEATGALTEFDAKFTEAWTSLGAALREAKAGHAAAELVTLGRSLARLSAEGAKAARGTAAALDGRTEIPAARVLIAEMRGDTAKIEQRAKQAAAAIEAMTTAEEFGVLVENSQVLAREQQRVMELAESSGDDPVKWAPVISRFRVSMAQAKVIEGILEPMADRERGLARDRAKALMRELPRRREEIGRTFAAGAVPDQRMLRTMGDYTRSVRDQLRNFSAWHREFGFRPVELMRSLAQETGPVYANAAKLREELDRLQKTGDMPADLKLALADGRWSLRGELFKTTGDLEEIRAQADNPFVGDLRKATAAIEALRAMAVASVPDRLREKLDELEAVLRVLESAHNLQECLDGFNHLAAGEEWDIRNLAARTDAPRDWRWLEGRMRALPDELNRARPERSDEALRAAFSEAQRIVARAGQLPAWRTLDAEMGGRADIDRAPVSAKPDAEMLAAEVKLALEQLRKPMDEARARLARISPSVGELAAALAKEQDAVKKDAPEPANQLPRQRQITRKVETLKDLIRADANKQNILDKEQRETMRDADDALAMLKDPPPKAEQALQDAAAAQPPQQKADLERAAAEQQKLADALGQIAKHFEAKEKGGPLDATRAAMREMEKELGIAEQLDQQQESAKMLAELAQKSAGELLKELEAKLPENPTMQKELSDITKDALAAAEQKLADASKKENSIAKQLADLTKKSPADAAKTASDAAKQAATAAQAAQKAAESAREQATLAGNPEATQKADSAAKQAATAAQSAEQAAQSAAQMEKSTDPQQTAQAAQQTAQKAGEAAQAAQQAAGEARQATASSQKAAKKGGEQQAPNQQATQQAAEAQKQANAAVQAAQQAQAAAQAAAAMAQQGPQLAKAAQEQQPVAANSQQAAADTQRAGRHEARLANQPAAEQLQKLAAAIQQTAAQTVPAAEKALAKAQMAGEAQPDVNRADAELAQALSNLRSAATGQPQTPQQRAAAQQGAQPPQASAAVQEAMARALDSLDQQLNGTPAQGAAGQQAGAKQQPGQQPGAQGQQPGQPQAGQQAGKPGDSNSQAESAMAQAAQAAADAMRMNRAESSATQPGSLIGGSQSEKSIAGAKAGGDGVASKALPDVQALKTGDWGRLPKKLADELTKGTQEAIPGEYRQAVEAYYRVIAGKAKKQ